MARLLWSQDRRVCPEDEAAADALRERWEHSVEELSAETRYYTDKFPGNFMHLGLARRFLPGMRVVWCRRNAADTALSIFANDFNRHIVPWANRLEHIALVWKAHEVLMEHWLVSLGVPIVQVRYESLVEDAQDQVRSLLERLSLEWEPACLRFHENRRLANTASFDQVRQPLYATSVGRYRLYGRRLDAFLASLNP
jgi:plasmid stabilization system protein ParE